MWSQCLDERNDFLDGREGRALAFLVIEGADTHEAMGAGLDAQRVRRRGPGTSKVADFQARFFGVGRIHDLRRAAVIVRPSAGTCARGFGEVGGVHATCVPLLTVMTVLRFVVLAVQQRADFEVAQVLRKSSASAPRVGPSALSSVRRPCPPRPRSSMLAHSGCGRALPAVAERARHSWAALGLLHCGRRGRFVRLAICSRSVRLHGREDVFHRGAQGRSFPDQWPPIQAIAPIRETLKADVFFGLTPDQPQRRCPDEETPGIGRKRIR